MWPVHSFMNYIARYTMYELHLQVHHLCDTIKATIYGQHGQQSIYGSSYLYGLYVTQLRQPFMGNMTLQSIYFINMKC
jgi:hypothetical protein